MTLDPNDQTDPRNVVIKFLDGLTAPIVSTYVRVGLYFLAGAAASYGYGDPANKWEAWALASGTFAITLAWTIYGQRIVVRIKGIMATGQVAGVITKEAGLANAVPDGRVISAQEARARAGGTILPPTPEGS